MERVLHAYFRSSSAYPVRVALNLKGLEAKHVPIHLTRGGGEHFTAECRKLNPLALVPVLTEGDLRLSQSLAILESLDERYPLPPLLPASIEDRTRARQLASTIACDVHPLNNLRVLKCLTGKNLGLARPLLCGPQPNDCRLLPDTADFQRSALRYRSVGIPDVARHSPSLRSAAGIPRRTSVASAGLRMSH